VKLGYNVRVRRYSVKVPAGWQLPNRSPDAAAREHIAWLENQMRDILDRGNRKRQSKLFPAETKADMPGQGALAKVNPVYDPIGLLDGRLTTGAIGSLGSMFVMMVTNSYLQVFLLVQSLCL
jgi:hypothetical protein